MARLLDWFRRKTHAEKVQDLREKKEIAELQSAINKLQTPNIKRWNPDVNQLGFLKFEKEEKR